jgi:hypothetical protein
LLEAYYLRRTWFDSIAKRKSRWRRLTEDGNIEISRRCLARAPDERGADRPGASQFDPFRTLGPAPEIEIPGNAGTFQHGDYALLDTARAAKETEDGWAPGDS